MKNLLTTKEVAKFLGVTGATVARYKKLGLISPAKKLGSRDLYKKSDIKSFVTPGKKRLVKNKPFYEMKKSTCRKSARGIDDLLDSLLPSAKETAMMELLARIEIKLTRRIKWLESLVFAIIFGLLTYIISSLVQTLVK